MKQKSFYCCSYDFNHGYRHNTTLCGNEDRDFFYFNGSDTHPTHNVHGCQCDLDSKDRLSVSPRESYEWVPEFCDLLPFSGPQFCSLLGNRTILLCGDSTMDQSSTTLMSMIQATGGGCAHQLYQGRSDLLFTETKYTSTLKAYLEKRPFDIVIFTAGAHLQDEGDMWSVLENVKNQMSQLKVRYPHIKWVWKTQNPGHVRCKDFLTPIKNFSVDPVHIEYNYHMFPKFDEITHQFISLETSLQWKVIDMSMLYLRPDAHADCMHLCLPGPLDVFSNILLTMLYTGEV